MLGVDLVREDVEMFQCLRQSQVFDEKIAQDVFVEILNAIVGVCGDEINRPFDDIPPLRIAVHHGSPRDNPLVSHSNQNKISKPGEFGYFTEGGVT